MANGVHNWHTNAIVANKIIIINFIWHLKNVTSAYKLIKKNSKTKTKQKSFSILKIEKKIYSNYFNFS